MSSERKTQLSKRHWGLGRTTSGERDSSKKCCRHHQKRIFAETIHAWLLFAAFCTLQCILPTELFYHWFHASSSVVVYIAQCCCLLASHKTSYFGDEICAVNTIYYIYGLVVLFFYPHHYHDVVVLREQTLSTQSLPGPRRVHTKANQQLDDCTMHPFSTCNFLGKLFTLWFTLPGHTLLPPSKGIQPNLCSLSRRESRPTLQIARSNFKFQWAADEMECSLK